MLDHFLPAMPALSLGYTGADTGPALSHFGQRAHQHGVRVVHGDRLKRAVEVALALGRDDVICKVFEICDDRVLYRVRLPEGLFYPVVTLAGIAVTVYPHSYLKRIRAGRRNRLRHTGQRKRQSKMEALK